MKPVLLIVACLCAVPPLSRAAAIDNVIKVESTTAAPGQNDVVVRILADHSAPIMGMSFAGTYDARLVFKSVSLDGTVFGASGLEAEYFAPLAGDGYFGAAVIIDLYDPYDFRELEAGTDHFVCAVTFDVAPGTAAGDVLPITLGDTFGHPIIDPVFTVNAETVTPSLQGGHIEIAAAPAIEAIAPEAGPAAGGTAVTITGAHFTAGAAVAIGGAPLADTVVVDAATITGRTPAHAPGSADVTVTTPYGSATLAGAFTYVMAPTITSVAPSSGAGDVEVHISGTGFTPDAEVRLAGELLAPVTFVSATELRVTLPACGMSAGWRRLEVTTLGGTAALDQGYFCEETAEAAFRRGDANCDGVVDIADAITVLAYLFSGGSVICRAALDGNDDGALDIADAIYVLAYLFAGGAPPPPPFPEPGLDPTPDALECAAPCGV